MMNSLLLVLLLSCPLLIHTAYFDPTACTNTTPCVFVTPNGVDTNNGTSAFPLRTIQQALKNLATVTIPTTIVLADGTYPAAPPGYVTGISWSGNNISLTSLNGAASTFIDCNQAANVRALWIGSGETQTTVISGITIQNCIATMGSGIAIVGPNTKPIIRDVQIIKNLATLGGGLIVFLASPTFINVNVTGNTANNGAGMMITHNATLLIQTQLHAMEIALNYPLNPNSLPTGEGSYVTMTNMRFLSNSGVGVTGVQSVAGAYLLMAAYGVSCTNCVFMGNTASGGGCIVAAFQSAMSVTNSMFANNMATQLNGGGISVQQGSTAAITGCSFFNNTAANGGGVAVGTLAMATVTNSIFDGNQAAQGSIVYNDAGSLATVSGCTARNNIAGIGGIYLNNPQSIAKFQPNSNTYSNNYATSNYGADYASYASSLAFITPNNSTNVGFSGHSPSILPVNTSTSLSSSVFNYLDTVTVKVLILDTFGQRMDLNSTNQTNLYATIMTLDNVTLSALLVQSTRVTMPGGEAVAGIQIVGEPEKSYAVQWSVDTPNIQPIRLYVTIKQCAQFAYVTYYQDTNFPICNQAVPHTLSDSTFQGILVISSILIACVLIVQGLTIWYWSTPVFKGSTPLFMSLMLFGAIIGYLATILSVVDVNRTSQFDAICKSQYWLMGVAFALMFGTLALKTWRIRNIFCNETLTEIKSLSTPALLRILGLILALEIAIHVIWVTVDPLQSTLTLSTGQLSYQCSSKHDNIFLIVNLVYNGLIALTCVIFAYQTRDVASSFNESRQLMIASYNMFICVIVIAALSLALPTEDARRTVYSVGSIFVITSTWFVLFFPKLYIAIFKSSYNNSTGLHSPGGKNSNSGGKNSGEHKISAAKSTAVPSSKSSFTHGHIPMATTSSSGCPTPTRSKANSGVNSGANSPAGTAATSPALLPTRLALNLGSRSSVTGSPVILAMNLPMGGSPAFASAVARQLSSTSRPPQHPIHHHDIILHDTPHHDPSGEMESVELHLDRSPFTHERRTSQPTLYGGHDILSTLRGSGIQPASE